MSLTKLWWQVNRQFFRGRIWYWHLILGDQPKSLMISFACHFAGVKYNINLLLLQYRYTVALHCSLLCCSALEDQSCAAAIKVGLIGQIYISAISTSLLKCHCISRSSPSKALGIGFEFRFSLHTIACCELIQNPLPDPTRCRIKWEPNKPNIWIFGYLAIWLHAMNMAKWGIPEKSIKNVAQRRWP